MKKNDQFYCLAFVNIMLSKHMMFRFSSVSLKGKKQIITCGFEKETTTNFKYS